MTPEERADPLLCDCCTAAGCDCDRSLEAFPLAAINAELRAALEQAERERDEALALAEPIPSLRDLANECTRRGLEIEALRAKLEQAERKLAEAPGERDQEWARALWPINPEGMVCSGPEVADDWRNQVAAKLSDAQQRAEQTKRERDSAARLYAASGEECDMLRAEIAELRRKLAAAGVEGSPPPGEDTTIGTLRAKLEQAERRVAELEENGRKLADIVDHAATLAAVVGNTHFPMDPANVRSRELGLLREVERG